MARSFATLGAIHLLLRIATRFVRDEPPAWR
jgi:hypothetical protein